MKLISQITTILTCITIFQLLQQGYSFQFASVKVQADVKTINTVTRYKFTYDRTQDDGLNPTAYATVPILSSDTVTITFPTSYSLSTVSCSISINSGTPFTPSNCQVSGNKVIASGVVTSNTYIANLILWVSNVINPSPAISTDYFYGTIGGDSSGPGTFASTAILQPGNFSSCYITFTPNTVNSTADMIITVVPKNTIGSAGSVTVQFPTNRRWANDISTTNYLPITSSMACSNKSGNVKSTFQCTGSTVDALVTAAYLFDSSVSNSFSFSINNFLSPPTQQPSDPITITSWISGSKIDTCTTYISNLSPKTITSLTVASSTGASIVVNKQILLRFTFILPDTIAQTDTIILNMPISTIFSMSISNISSNFSINPNTTTYDSDNRNMYLYMLSQGRIFVAGSVLILTVGTYTAPPSIQPTDVFTLTIYRNGYPKIKGTTTLTATASTLLAAVNATSSVVNVVTSYIFTITTYDILSTSGKIKLIFPTTITISAVPTSCASISTVGIGIPTCAINTIQNSITLNNMNISSTATIPATTMIFTISGIKNPSSVAPTLPIIVNTYYKNTDASMVATGGTSSIVATIATIDSSKVAVSASSDVVNQLSVTYSLSVTITNPIPAGGNFSIYVPPQILFTLSSVPGHCAININSASYTPTSCVADIKSPGYIINFTNPFPVDMSISSTFIARISSIFSNPSSTRPTSSFALYTYSSNGYAIASIENSLTIAMITPDSFQSIAVTRASDKNYDITTYTFNIRQKSMIQASSIFIIGFPINVVPSSSSTCAITSPSNSALGCTYSMPNIKISLPATTIASNVPVIITINNIRNPASFAPTGTFTFQSKTIGQLYNYSYGLYNPLLNNSVATAFQSISYVFSPAIYGSPTSLTLTFNPSQSGTIPSSLRISLANSFTLSTLSCNSFIDLTATCNMITSNTIELTGTFTSSAMTFSITGITAPLNIVSDYTQIVTFDSSGYKLDQSTNKVIFAITCTMPCRTCDPATPTVCLSCYNNTAITAYIYQDTTLRKCYIQCVDGKFQNTTTFKCDLCDPICLTCQTSASYCITCNTTSTYKYLLINTTLNTQKCVSVCPSQMYPQTSINPTTCKSCISPCKQCTTSTTCTSCIAGTFYYLSQCLTDCPTGIAIKNSGTNNCDYCDTNCLTCINTTTTCTSCNQTLLLYLSQCRTSCPAPLVPQNGTCGPCDTSCKTCTGNKFNCTSCQPTSTLPYLLNNLCLSTCPQTYYPNTASSICSLCSSVAGLNCNNCSTASICLSCNTGYVLYQQKCLNYTPDGYVNISGVAIPCSGDCATCSISATNCTSCKNYNLYNYQCLVNCLAGFVAISKVCQPCLSPCRTCQTTIDTCTTCLTTLTPSVFLSNSQCVQTCPQGTYPTRTNYSCLACKTPCQYCQSLTLCDTCLNGYFLQGTSCVTTCQTGYTGVDRVCSPCLGNCATCINQTNICTSCKTDTYFLAVNNSCVTSCGTGLYIYYLTRTCVACSDPCKTCTNTSDTCLSCTTGVLFNNQCLDQCPQKYFQQSGQCRQCPANCSACTSLVNCTGCSQNYVLYNGFCITGCPPTDAVIINSVCTKCSTVNCHKCTSADFCTQCASKYSLYNGACLSVCPAAFQTNGTHCIDTNVQVLTSSSSFPVPFSIAAVVVIIACLMSKLQFNHTFLPGAIYSILSILQWGALIYFLYLYFIGYFINQPLPFLVGVAAIAYLMLLNILALFIQNLTLCNDKMFKSWYNDRTHKIATILTNIVSTICNHKFRNILFCKLFTFAVFSASLQSTSKFKVLYIFSFLSLLHSGAAIFAAAAATRSAESSTQLYYACIDVIVVTAVNGILAFFNIMKPKDYFYQRTPDGFQLKKRITGDDDGFLQKLQPAGKANQDQQGFIANVYRVQAGTGFTTNQPFKGYSNEDKDYSYGSLIEKSAEEVSVQAVQQIQDKQGQAQINSDFSIIFPKSTSKSGFLYNTQSKLQPSSQISIQASPKLPRNNQLSSKMQQKVYNKSDRQLSPKRTVFFKQQPGYSTGPQNKSVQIGDKNKKMSKVSQRRVFDSSGEQTKSQIKKNSNILYKPDLASKFAKKAQPVLYVQAGPQMTNTSNNAYAGDNKPILKQQLKYTKDQGVQRYQPNNQKAKFEQSQQQIKQQPISNVIFEEQQRDFTSPRRQIKQQLPTGLKQNTKDQLLLPNQEIQQYQKQLESKIKQKDDQINLMKKKIQTKQKLFNQFNDDSEPSEIVEAGKLYRKGQMRKSQTRDRRYDQQQSPTNNEKINEQIIVINQDGEPKKIKVQINDDKSKQTEQDFISMLEDHQDQLIYEQQEKEQIPQNINKIQANQSLTTMLKPQPQQLQYKQSEGQISSGKDRSTKIQSSAMNMRIKGGQTDNTLINVNQIQKSGDQDSQGIHDRPLGPDVMNIRTDLSDTLQPISKQGLNKTLGNLKNKQTVRVGEYSQRQPRQNLSKQKKQGRYEIKQDAQPKQGQLGDGLPKKAQSMNKPNPLKTINRFQFQNYEKNISQSGEDQSTFNRIRPNLVVPFETDKQQTQFKSSQIQSPRRVMIPRQTRTIPVSRSNSNSYRTPKPNQVQRQVSSNNPLIIQMQQNQGKSRDKNQLEFGPPDRDDEPYIEQDDQDSNDKYKNTIVIDKMQERPDNDDLRKYYEQHEAKKSKSRDKSKKKPSQAQLQTQKIYLQQQTPSSSGKKWK